MIEGDGQADRQGQQDILADDVPPVRDIVDLPQVIDRRYSSRVASASAGAEDRLDGSEE